MTDTTTSTRRPGASATPSGSERDAAIAAMLAANPPADLAGACTWAVEHSRWINDPADDDRNWPDERVEAEAARYDAVVRRAIHEPSRSHVDLKAKAELLLHEYRVDGLNEDLSDDERLLRVVLREVTAKAASGAQGLPDPGVVMASFDVSSLPLCTLETLHAVAGEVRGHCLAIECQPRCLLNEPSPQQTFNPAGLFAVWLGEIADRIRDRVVDEARARAPANQQCRESRLSILAAATIANDNKAELVAFIADLTAYAAEA